MSEQPEIFFHVGLGKVASTWLQRLFFPVMRGIQYLPTNRYHKAVQLIHNQPEVSKWLVSREFDRQYEREVRKFVEVFPQARIIIFLRPHADWITSQYKRYVKNGWYHAFDSFIDLEKDSGFWKKADLLYYPKLALAEQLTGKPPLVLFHDDLKNDPFTLLDRIARFCGASYDRSHVSLQPIHTSFSEKQLLFLRTFCKKYVRKIPQGKASKLWNWLTFRPWWAFFHLILYAVPLLPRQWIPNEPLIPKHLLDDIQITCQDDWEQVRQYAAKNNPT